MRVSLFGSDAKFGERPRQLEQKYSKHVYTVAKRFFTLPALYAVAGEDKIILKIRYYGDQLLLVRTNIDV